MPADSFAESVVESFRFCLDHASRHRDDLAPLALQWLDHATAHLWDRLDLYFRDGHRRLRTEEQMRAVIKGLAVDLQTASADLKAAAEALRAAGKGLPANRAYAAHLRTRDQAALLE